ncbi:MAG: AAA family ATPase [Pseudomonadota bacterium]
MRLLAVTVKNVRLHRELSVAFDAQRTVVAGPNESGKSTLMEAIQQVLFLKAKGNTKEHRKLQSLTHGDKPAVILEFECESRRYTLEKQFKGQSGAIRLTEVGGATLQDAQAEEKLAVILRRDEANQQWDHVFVVQGDAGNDPTAFANTHRGDLVARFQTTGGAVLQQSAVDAAVAARVKAEYEAIFTTAERPRANSPLANATGDEEEARTRRERAESTINSRHAAIRDHAAAEDAIGQCDENIRRLDAEKADLQERQRTIQALNATLAEAREGQAVASDRLHQLERAEQDIEAARRALQQASAALLPLDRDIQTAKTALDDRRNRRQQLATALEAANTRAEAARTQFKLAQIVAALREVEAELVELEQNQAKVDDLASKLTVAGASLAQLPAIDGAKLEELKHLQLQITTGTATINAIAASIEVVASDQLVTLDGEPLSAGEPQIFTDAAEVRVGDRVSLRIQPGGGENLETSRSELANHQRELTRCLQEVGVGDLDQASYALQQRQVLERDIQALEERLADEGGAALATKTEERNEQRLALRTQLRGLTEEHDSLALATLADAKQQLVEAESARDFEQTESDRLRQQLDDADAACRDAEGRRSSAAAGAEKARQHQSDADARVRILLEQHGGDDDRVADLVRQRAQVSDQAERLAEIDARLQEAQPELVEQDAARIQRALTTQTEQRATANDTLQRALGALRSDGSSDPEAELANATAELEAASERRQRAERYGDAIARLEALFTEKQQQLADEFTRPLAEKAAEYLRLVLGNDTRINLHFDGAKFKSLALYRDAVADTAFEFDTLSGGTREQLAAALRLAIAELLAADFGGCLPLVFDDAFANADPARTRGLQRMLDLGAARGLQIIILTCDPQAYSGFGAAQVTMPAAGGVEVG